ncbi:unnamed protein product [Mytilus coruscus]|uniref:Apple domain-containing protein n=1 Tax=Mytilus coruscus TaxID=42192 RepID=A0A6J8E8U5_MYTCO|nr:unnamed protein product [Mytilus coruscus]
MNYFSVCISIFLTWKSIHGFISIKGYGSSKVNSQFLLACYIPSFNSGATWSTSNAYITPITCTSGGFCETVSRDNYRFFGNASGIFVVIDPLQHKDNQMKWTCYFASARTSYTIKINSELPSGLQTESAYALANFDVEIILPTCTCNHWNNLVEGDKINCHYQETGSQKITVTCPPNTKGRYVRIKRRDTGYLIICEIEVYGNPVNSLHESDVNIALKKPTELSSIYKPEYVCCDSDYAVDGDMREWVGLESRTNTAYACGHIGYKYLGPVIDKSAAQSNIQCTIMCINKTACTAAEYDKKTNFCTLKGQIMNGTQSSLHPDSDKNTFFIQ